MVGAAYFLCRRSRPSHDSNFGGFSSVEGGVGGERIREIGKETQTSCL